MSSTGTFANHRIGVSLKLNGAQAGVPISGVTSFQVSLDLNREEWVEFASLGWTSNKITTKSMTLAIEAKYKGNDDLHTALMKLFLGGGSAGHNDHELEVTFPIAKPDTNNTPAKLVLPVSISPSDVLGGDSESLSPFSMEMMVDGVPIYTEESV